MSEITIRFPDTKGMRLALNALARWAEYRDDDFGRYGATAKDYAQVAPIVDAALAAEPPKVECFGCRTTWSGAVSAPPIVVPTCSRCGKPCDGGHWVVASGASPK
jgi:hypothetical protein